MDCFAAMKFILWASAACAALVVAVLIHLLTRAPGAPQVRSPDSSPAHDRAFPENLAFEPRPIGASVKGRPAITHLLIVDLDQDGLPDVVACDGESNSVCWLRQSPRGTFTESQLGEKIAGPAHAFACDLNGDGRLDLLIAGMGIIAPNNDKIGSVVVLENQGHGRFKNHVIADTIARVTDVRGADVNGDGRIDLIAGQFGYNEGEIRWMENLGDWQFRSHILLSEPGTIHTPVADYDGDGRIDFAALVSQDSEAVHLFSGSGAGGFRDNILWQSTNKSWGSSGLELCDLNRDGRPDLLYTNGDGFDGLVSLPPWHGLQWLENRPDHGFVYHRIGDFPGCYSPTAADLDGDGDIDILAVSAFNNWHDPAAVSLMAWLNDGAEQFTAVPLAHAPTHLLALAVGDIDGDGRPEILTGGFHIYPPWTNMSRITLWKRR